MILARLLTAVDFGLIALITVFIAVADTIAQGGYKSTIVVRQNLQDIDLSTAFVYNLAVAFLLYLIMFFTAPLIAAFYNEPRLIILVRTLGLVNILHAGYFVQDALLNKQLKFKLLAQRNVMALFFSGMIAIALAYFGYGVWSLVSLTLLRALFINIYLWTKSVWKFSLRFSYASFRQNFSFGFRMMLTVITNVLFNNLNNLLIGKYYSKADLGYYYQARKLRDLPVESACGVLNKTSGPLLAKSQADLSALRITYFRIIRIAAICIVPIVTLLFITGRDLITVLFSAKWVDSVPIFRIIILSGLFMPFIIINGLSPVVMGDSKYFLKLDSIMKVFYLGVVFVALRFGLLAFIASQTCLAGLQMIINAFVARRFFQVRLKAQISVYLPYYIYCLAAGMVAYLLTLIPGLMPVIRLTATIVLFVGLYVGLVYMFERKTFKDIIRLIRSGLDKLQAKANGPAVDIGVSN